MCFTTDYSLLCVHQTMHRCLSALFLGSCNMIVSASVFTKLNWTRKDWSVIMHFSLCYRIECVCDVKEQEGSAMRVTLCQHVFILMRKLCMFVFQEGQPKVSF